MSNREPTKRFSERVELYVKYRPSYPTAVLGYLRGTFGLTKTAVVADIGFGTGISSKLFLENGNRVVGVEPNREMREAGEAFLANFDQFRSASGTAEATTLDDESVDWVVAGQAFHWFDPALTKQEFARILRPNGRILLMWNMQDVTDPLMEAYEEAVRQHSLDFDKTKHTKNREGDEEAFLGEGMKTAVFDNVQQFDLEGFLGRALSSSYTPMADHPNHQLFLDALVQLFESFAKNGRVSFHYKTRVFVS